jgi:tyrosine-protein phosphatase SIW14
MKVTKLCKHLPVVTLAVISSYAFAADLDLTGVHNFHKVNEHLYRGAQPTDEGWKTLAKLGVKTVVDLRLPDEHSTAAEEKAVDAAGMRYVNIPMQGVVTPSEASISKALAIMKSEAEGPVFVHCKRGADRTGTVIAVYRMAHDGWANHQAMHEAKSYGMRWTQIGLKHYVSTYRAPDVVATASTEERRPL